MKFKYELKINGKDASLEVQAPSMDSVMDSFSLNGPTKDVEYLKRKVNWELPFVEILDRLNKMHFCKVVSSKEEETPVVNLRSSWGFTPSAKKSEPVKEESSDVEETVED